MASKRTADDRKGSTGQGDGVSPPSPRLRLKLSTIDNVKREMARLYRTAKARQMDVGDASKLANMLALMGRLIEGADLERRIAAIEAAQAEEESPR